MDYELDLGIHIDGANGRLQVKGGSVSFAQIRHIIVNRDTSPNDLVAGAVVIQTMPNETNLLVMSPAANSYEFVVEGNNKGDAARKTEALGDFTVALKECVSDYGIGVTTTSIPQDRFHETFAID